MIQAIKDLSSLINSDFQWIIGIIAGALLTYLFGTRTLKKQLKHDSIEKDKERKLSIKKELYLQAVEIFSKTSTYLHSIMNVNLKDTNIYDGFKDFFTSILKITLIADKETVAAVTELSIAYQKLIFQILPKLTTLSEIKNKLDIEMKFYNKSTQEIERVLMQMTDNNESLTGSIDKFERLNRTYIAERESQEKYNDNWQKLNNQYLQEQFKFSKELLEEDKKISPLIDKAFFCLRKELEIDTDMQYFNDLFKQQKTNIEEDQQKFIDYLENLIKEFDKNG